MTTEGDRRFTDREVALVLRAASELEEREGESRGGGLSLTDLEEIAGEVGIPKAAVARAVAQLDARARRANPLAGGRLTHRAIRAVPGELDEEGKARLFSYVDGASDSVGSISEALGATQWTSVDRFRTRQVSLTPGHGETSVQVVERATARLRRMIHLVPAAFGLALTAGTVGGLDPSSGAVAAFMALGAAVGGTVGRFLWTRLSDRSAARVEALAGELARQASADSEPLA